jgi:cytoskeletal protein CcmA (bactofilin family)
MNDTLLQLATSTFGTLTDAEERFFKAVGSGAFVDYSSAVEAENNPALAEIWPESRALAGDRISWLATDPDASRFVTHRGIGIKGARIVGRLDLHAANIIYGLYLDHCAIPAGINLLSAEIHSLNLSGSHTGRITADGIKVEAGVFLRGGFRSAGRVRLIGAQIGANLDCSGGIFMPTDGETLVADSMKVAGSVLLNQGFHSEGEVRILGAEIQGNLSCDHGEFINPGQVALSADRTHIHGNIFLSDGFLGLGRVALTSAIIDGFLVWRNIERPRDTSLDLRSAHIGTLWFGRESWPPEGKLLLHGLSFKTLDDQNALTAETWIDWLRLQPAKPFRPQPYEQLAAVLQTSGQDNDAKDVLYAKEIDRAQRGELSWSQVPWYRIFGPLIGYGYKPWRAFWLSLAVVILGTVLFGLGEHYDLMVPAKFDGFVTARDGSRSLTDDYPRMSPFMYSLDAFTPLISLDQAEYWLPAANRGAAFDVGPIHFTTGNLLRIYMWFHIIAGWVLSTLLFVGLTGSVPGA